MAFSIAFLEIHLHIAHLEVEKCRAAPLRSKQNVRYLPASTADSPYAADVDTLLIGFGIHALM